MDENFADHARTTRFLSLPTSQPLLPSSSVSPLTPPITPDVSKSVLALPTSSSLEDECDPLASIMASTTMSSIPSNLPQHGFLAPDASPFEAHILALLSSISQPPSPSYPFPDPAISAGVSNYVGDKTQAQDLIERAILGLGQRTWNAERSVTGGSGFKAPLDPTSSGMDSRQVTELPTPDWTPPIFPSSVPVQQGQTVSSIGSAGACPTCTRPVELEQRQQFTTSATFPSFSSHPLSASLSTPPAQLSAIRPLGGSNALNPNPHSILTTSNGASVLTGGPGAAGWSVRGAVGESGMTAEKELELLKAQVQDIARVCKAVATGDLTQKIIVPVEGQAMTELKDIINSMVDRLKTFAVEVERVSLEVGTQGKLGGQAVVEGVEGTWRELTAVVNKLAANLTSQVRSIAKVTKAVAKGDLSETIDVEASGEIAELKTTVNGMVMSLRTLADEVSRVSLEVGSQGKLGGQAYVPDVEGVWKDLTVNVSGIGW